MGTGEEPIGDDSIGEHSLFGDFMLLIFFMRLSQTPSLTALSSQGCLSAAAAATG